MRFPPAAPCYSPRFAVFLTLLVMLPGCNGCQEPEDAAPEPPPVEVPRPRDPADPPRKKAKGALPDESAGSKEEGGAPETGEKPAEKRSPDTRKRGKNAPGGSDRSANEPSEAKGSAGKSLDDARELKKLAEKDEKAGKPSAAYAKLLEAWKLAREHSDEPDAAGLVGTLQGDLARLKTLLNSNEAPSNDKLIRVK